jgi:hypothetical protein
MKRFILFVNLIAIAIIFSGCATPYQSESLTGGYKSMKVQDDVFKVSFRGNASTRSEQTENFVLLRCAEVTLENGYNYFVIIDSNTAIRTSTLTTPVTANTSGMLMPIGNMASYHAQTTYSGGNTRIYQRPTTTNEIKCFKEKPENMSAIVYDAKQIRDNLKQAYGIK